MNLNLSEELFSKAKAIKNLQAMGLNAMEIFRELNVNYPVTTIEFIKKVMDSGNSDKVNESSATGKQLLNEDK